MTERKSEICLICNSLNHLVIENNNEAFSCWNCGQNYWIDDLARLEYMITRKRSLKQAEKDLIAGKPHFCFVGDINE